MARRMMSERMIGLAPFVVTIVAGAFIAVLMPSTVLQVGVFIGVVVAVVVLANRRSGDGPGRGR